jgi:hypothetical protein
MMGSKTMAPSEAAEGAGYKNPSVAANKLMKNEVIRAALGREILEREKRTNKTADDVVRFLHNVLEIDVTEIFDDEGYTTMEKIRKLPREIRICIQGIETDYKYERTGDGEFEKKEVVKVKWMSKDRALELALKHHGLLQPDLQLHILNDDMKSQVLMEILERMQNMKNNVVDVDYIEKAVQEDNDETRD